MSLIRNDVPVRAAGIELDLTRMCLPRNLQQRYGELATVAVREMEFIETGGIANVEEGRPVGHYWLRSPDQAPRAFQEAIPETWRRIEDFANEQFAGRFENILWIGIGGSGLAPQLVRDALRTPGQLPRMFFFDNTDPSGFRDTLLDIAAAGGLDKTLCVVVSKSGTTDEPHNGMVVAQRSYKSVKDFASHAMAITMPESYLAKEAGRAHCDKEITNQPAWLECLPIWKWVGGRTSLFSAVGLLPARLIGADIQQLLAGAREMDAATREDRMHENPALLMAVAWYHAVETSGLRNMVVLPYCDRLSLLGKYLQQLVMESLGKELKGISVFGNKGSTDQHSYVQQLREGYADFFAVFVRTLQPQEDWELEDDITVGDYLAAFQEGTAQALSEAGRPSMRLTLKRLDAYSLGALVALFERAVGYYGAMLGINAYNQPGVEGGKKAAKDIIRLHKAIVSDVRQAGPKGISVAQLAKKNAASPRLVFDILNRLVCCGRCGMTRVGDADAAIEEQVFVDGKNAKEDVR